MPLTPYHWGPPLLVVGLYFALTRKPLHRDQWFHLLIVLYGAVVPDIQGIYSLLVDRTVQIHGFSHTLLGAGVYSVVSAVLYRLLRPQLVRLLGLKKPGSVRQVFILVLCSIIVFHLIPDMFIWTDMMVFYPASSWSVGETSRYQIIASAMGLAFVAGSAVVFLLFLGDNKTDAS